MLSVSLDASVEGELSAEQLQRLEAQLGRMVEAAWLTDCTDRELEVDLRLCDDELMQELNRDYRGKDQPTDVLAFSQREGEGGDLCPEILGDIVISIPTALRQTKTDLYGELIFLAAHGLCHLLGYDHQDDDEELAMNQRMQALITESERAGAVEAA